MCPLLLQIHFNVRISLRMDNDIIEKVRSIIAEGKLSRAGLARAAGLHANTLRDCSEPKWNPTADTLAKLDSFLAANDETPWPPWAST